MLAFDIGANVGAWSLANSDPSKRIIAVEASPITFETLRGRVAAHANIIPLNYAVSSDTSEFATFYHCARADTLSTLDLDWIKSEKSRFANYHAGMKTFNVPIISIDKMIATYGIPDLIKVDVEGAENIVIRSLTQKTPQLCFEWAAEWRDKYKEVVLHLSALGYTKFHVQIMDNYTYTPDSYNLSSDDILAYLDNAKDKVDWGMIWAI